jgi:hypothetical protein
MLEPSRVFAIHRWIIAGLALANVPIAIMDRLGHHLLLGYSQLMRLEAEANIPTAFSSLALVACAVVAQAIRTRLGPADRDRAAWGLLATLFVFLAIDEAAMLHELANGIGTHWGLGGGLLYFGIFIYVPVVVFLALRLFPFWLRQDPHARLLLCLGGAIYVFGAVGLELVENHLRAAGVTHYDLPLRISVVIEECAEMFAVALFLKAFLDRFSALGGGLLVRLTVRDGRAETVVEPGQNTAMSSTP